MPSQLGTRQRIFQIFFFFAECWVRKALGKGFFKKNIFFFAECRVRKTLGKGFFKIFFSLPSAGLGRHSAKDFSKKKGKALPSAFLTRHSTKTPSTADGQFSLPSAVLALSKAFAECPTNGTRQRTLRRMRLCRLLFAECGTRQSLCRVQ